MLVSIINKYIESAEPISSKYLEKSGFFDLSSATIRAEMNELECCGFLAQLHTSSGRVPTDAAYRYFLNNLAENQDYGISDNQKKMIKRALKAADPDPKEINKSIAQLLCELSDNLVITGIEEQEDFYKVGLSSLFDMPEFREFDKTFRLANFFDDFEKIFDRIERNFFEMAEPDNEVKVFIGRENPLKDMKDETIMFAKYNLPQNLTGSLTLVGPTRMDYRKNIGLMKYTTEELNKLAKRA